jgi:hypothetical protein
MRSPNAAPRVSLALLLCGAALGTHVAITEFSCRNVCTRCGHKWAYDIVDARDERAYCYSPDLDVVPAVPRCFGDDPMEELGCLSLAMTTVLKDSMLTPEQNIGSRRRLHGDEPVDGTTVDVHDGVSNVDGGDSGWNMPDEHYDHAGFNVLSYVPTDIPFCPPCTVPTPVPTMAPTTRPTAACKPGQYIRRSTTTLCTRLRFRPSHTAISLTPMRTTDTTLPTMMW